jgi:CheY-like chemotaxis protein
LVVDDEETVRLVVGSHLDELGLEVVEAGDGNEALEVLEKTQPQLIITDISMPGMHGLELIKAVKDSQEHRDIPIMVITALGAETTYGMATRDYAFRWGCDDFIYKPFGKQEFMTRVGRILGKV